MKPTLRVGVDNTGELVRCMEDGDGWRLRWKDRLRTTSVLLIFINYSTGEERPCFAINRKCIFSHRNLASLSCQGGRVAAVSSTNMANLLNTRGSDWFLWLQRPSQLVVCTREDISLRFASCWAVLPSPLSSAYKCNDWKVILPTMTVRCLLPRNRKTSHFSGCIGQLTGRNTFSSLHLLARYTQSRPATTAS